MIEELILALKKEKAYQELNAYYGQATPFSILSVERSENRHSSFIHWLLNPSSSHSLTDAPLRDFLSLLARKADSQEKCFYPQVRERLITGDYELEVLDSGVERSIVSLLGSKREDAIPYLESTKKGDVGTGSANRFDIWMLLKISFVNKDDNTETWTIPLVIENKIYSKEGGYQRPEKGTNGALPSDYQYAEESVMLRQLLSTSSGLPLTRRGRFSDFTILYQDFLSGPSGLCHTACGIPFHLQRI